jgi:hypothetical protein
MVIQANQNNKTRLHASISKMTKEHVLVKESKDKDGDKKIYSRNVKVWGRV